MKFLKQDSLDPHWNMAFDSHVLEHTDFEGFYLWQDAPSVIVGLSQSVYAEVNLPYIREHEISLARRVSGGGAVYHDLGNLNYTFIGYEEGPALIADALRYMGVPAELTGRNDILVEGRKCSGYAKRLAAGRVMVHGTLMFDVDIEELTNALSVPGSKLSAAGVSSVRSRVCNLKEYLPYGTVAEFRAALQERLGGEAAELPCIGSDVRFKETVEKFRSWDWIYGKSPKTDFAETRKLPSGTVTMRYSLKRGRFSEVFFEGDFIGSRPAAELAEKLIGLKPEELSSIDTSPYFDGGL